MSFGFGFSLPAYYGALRVGAWSPSVLFANGEPGVWYDPSDLSTLYQDAAGTTPVTAVEQPVGLMLDKSKGLVLGPELVTNGDFSNGLTGWTQTGGYTPTVSGGALVFNGGSSTGGVYRTLGSVGKVYQITYTITAYTAGSFKVSVGTAYGPLRTAAGTYTETRQAIGDNLLRIYGEGTTFVGTIDNISVRELPGNHAYQSVSSTSRPVLSARVNLLTKTEQFDDAVWLKAASGSGVLPTVSVDAGLSPIGTQTADLITINRSTTTGLSFLTQRLTDDGVQKSRGLYVKAFDLSDIGKVIDTWTFDGAVANRFAITLTAEWQKVTLPNVTLSAGASRETVAFGYLDNGSLSPNTGQIKFYIWGASLVPSNQSSLPYQRVNTDTDYDADPAKFPAYLRFDGSDDWLVTNTITPGIDRAQVFAGVRKLSDVGAANAAFIAEFSASINANNGTFLLEASDSFAPARKYGFASRGTSLLVTAANNDSAYTAPVTNVLTGLGDISGDRAILRINGTQAAISTADQGTGNYLAYPLYIGRRGGTTLPFNGHLYNLIVRFGANLPAATIENTENYVNTKTRAF